MKMFLKPLLRVLKRFFQVNFTLEKCDVLPKTLSGTESVSRFCFKRDFHGETGNPKTHVFLPELYQEKYETSVCRKTNLTEECIWEISKIVEKSRAKEVVGRADLGVSVALEKRLIAEAEPGNYPEHSIIIGWPAGEEETAKAKRKSIAQDLAYDAKTVKLPN